MSRKVMVEEGGKKYRVDSNDIEKIVEHFELDKGLILDRKKLESFGLMYLSCLSNMGGGAGDMTLFDKYDGFSETQRELFKPALKKIAEYYNQKSS